MRMAVVLLVICSALDNTKSIQRSEGLLPDDDKYSFMVGIIKTNNTEHTRKLYCIGTFIRNSIIITPSHCLSYYYNQNLSTNADEIIYYVQHSVNEITVSSDGNLGTKINRGQVHFHPNYNKTEEHCNDFDVALIKLPTSDGFFPPPIDFCQENTSANVETPIIISWIDHAKPNGPYKLNYAGFTVLDKTECIFDKPILREHHICTKGTKKSRSSNGDSGSPLIHPEEFCQFGMLYCGILNYVLFVNVSYFTDWIDTVEKLNTEVEQTTELTIRTTIEEINSKPDSTTQETEDATETSHIDTDTGKLFRYIWIGVILSVVCIVAALFYFCQRRYNQTQSTEHAVRYKSCETSNNEHWTATASSDSSV